jgi:hypothetical protein
MLPDVGSRKLCTDSATQSNVPDTGLGSEMQFPQPNVMLPDMLSRQ